MIRDGFHRRGAGFQPVRTSWKLVPTQAPEDAVTVRHAAAITTTVHPLRSNS
jgi:hypothetical protein